MVAGASVEGPAMATQFSECISYMRASIRSIEEAAHLNDIPRAMSQMIASQRQCLSAWESVAPILENALASKSISAKMYLAESKCASNLRTLGANKAEFKNWNERLINALAQSLGTQWRPFMQNLNRALDTTRKVLDHEDLEDIEGSDEV